MNVSMVEGRPGIWSYTITLPTDVTQYLTYRIFIQDKSGNIISSPGEVVSIQDNDPPEILLTMDETPVKGQPFVFTIGVNDNLGLSRGNLVYWYGKEQHFSITRPGEFIHLYTLSIPRQ